MTFNCNIFVLQKHDISSLCSTVTTIYTNLLGSFLPKLFSQGGAVRKGQPTIVGEKGAEMFIPNQTGQITQSARGTGGSPVNVNFAITTLDATGFQDMLVQNRGTISSIINQAVNERGGNNLV